VTTDDRIEALVFDLDGTICEYRRSSQDLLDIAFRDVGIEPVFSAEEYHAVFDGHADEANGIHETLQSATPSITTYVGCTTPACAPCGWIETVSMTRCQSHTTGSSRCGNCSENPGVVTDCRRLAAPSPCRRQDRPCEAVTRSTRNVLSVPSTGEELA